VNTTLAQKLGINEATRLYVQNCPFDYVKLIGVDKIKMSKFPKPESMDVIHIFCNNLYQLEVGILEHRKNIHNEGMIWVSWPKKSSGINTDISDGNIRDFPLATGLVDVKVCSINETWSALKFVIRKKYR